MRAVVVPAAPALLPGLGGAADPLAGLRERARSLVADTVTKGVTRLVVVGAAGSTATWPTDAPSGAARFTTGRVPEGALPTDLEIGRLLLPAGQFASSAGGERVLQSIAVDADPATCLGLGRSVSEDGTLLLVVADGPATLTEKAPGHLDAGAAPFALDLRRALAAADASALADLDSATCDRLWMRGRPALQVLAGAFDGREATGEVVADESPYGVQYLLVRWS